MDLDTKMEWWLFRNGIKSMRWCWLVGVVLGMVGTAWAGPLAQRDLDEIAKLGAARGHSPEAVNRLVEREDVIILGCYIGGWIRTGQAQQIAQVEDERMEVGAFRGPGIFPAVYEGLNVGHEGGADQGMPVSNAG